MTGQNAAPGSGPLFSQTASDSGDWPGRTGEQDRLAGRRTPPAADGRQQGSSRTQFGRRSGPAFLQGRTWYFLLSLNILLAVVLSLILVWVSIERMDINYFINIERVNLREKQALRGKLEVEKERLLSPYELRINAEKLGMKAPAPGQIRRMDSRNRTP